MDAEHVSTVTPLVRRTIGRAILRPEEQTRSARRLLGDSQTPGEVAWRLERIVGEGGMGKIWRARQESLHRPVAVKILHEHLGDRVGDLVTEATVTAALDHPGIVAVHDLACDNDGKVFYVMRLIQGRSWIDSIGWDLVKDVETLLSLCQTVAYAHSRGVLHRDIKPENVMLGKYGEVLLCDWGLAAGFLPESPAPPAPFHPAGTPAFMAPEMADPRLADLGPGADVYLLGGSLWQALTHDAPHPGQDVQETLTAARANVIRTPPWGITRKNTADYRELEKIALRAMATKPGDRYPGALALAAALREWLSGRAGRAVLTRAQENLTTAVSYDEITRVLTGCDEAERLAPGIEVGEVRCRARLRIAELAIGRGDLDLAATYLDVDDPAHAQAFAELRRLNDLRLEASQASQRLAAAEAETRADSTRVWQRVFDMNFTKVTESEVSTACHLAGSWSLGPEGLRLTSGYPSAVLAKIRVPGDVRITAVMRQDDWCDDLGVVASCVLAEGDAVDGRALKSGWYASVGLNGNHRDAICRGDHAVLEESAQTIVRGAWTTLRLEIIGRHIHFQVSGRTGMTLTYPQIMSGPEHAIHGVSSYFSPTIIQSLRIEHLGASPKEDLLDTAERHLLAGHVQTAEDLLMDLLGGGLEGTRRLRLQEMQRRVWEARRLTKHHQEVAARLMALMPGAIFLGSGEQCDLTVPPGALTALRVLTGIPLTALRLPPQSVANLHGLEGMPLQTLTANGNGISDLTPLTRLPLRELRLHDNQVSDPGPLAGKRLEVLFLSRNPLTVTPRPDLDTLQRLHIAGVKGLQLASLAGPCLWQLDISCCGIRDLTPLRGCPLRELWADDNEIIEIEPVVRRHLSRAHLANNQITDLAPFAGQVPSFLDVSRNAISDIGPLAELDSMYLMLGVNPIRDLRPLAGGRLAFLDLSGCPVEDVSPLGDEDSRIDTLVVNWCHQIDQQSLARLRVETLHGADSFLDDGAILAGVASRVLELGGVNLKNLPLLLSKPPRRLLLWHPELDQDMVAEAQRLVNGKTQSGETLAQDLDLLAMVLRQDWLGLRQRARPDARGVPSLVLSTPMTQAETLDLCQRTGAVLAPVGSRKIHPAPVMPKWLADDQGAPITLIWGQPGPAPSAGWRALPVLSWPTFA